MTITVNVHEAKTHLSRLLARVGVGEEIIIARAGVPIARLVPISPHVRARVPGTAANKIISAPDFDAPLPDEVLAEFEQLGCCSTRRCSSGGSLTAQP